MNKYDTQPAFQWCKLVEDDSPEIGFLKPYIYGLLLWIAHICYSTQKPHEKQSQTYKKSVDFPVKNGYTVHSQHPYSSH